MGLDVKESFVFDTSIGGNNEAHIVQLNRENYNANLKKILEDEK